MTAVLLPPSALAQATPQHELLIGVDFDGTADFSATDPFDDGLGAHTPGLDLNANNNVLRTNDQIQYNMTWNANEADATGLTIRTSLPPNMEWLPDVTTVFGAPFGCTDDGTSTINTPNVGDLVCIIPGLQIQGSNGTIHPRALLNGELDGVVLSLTGTVESNENTTPATSNTIETTVSAAPAGDWIKGAPITDANLNAVGYEPDEEYFDVLDENDVPGRLLIWSLRLEPNGGIKGAEPINDSVDIQFFDHFFDSLPSAQLATATMMPANNLGQLRTPCGGYDGDGAYPYGQTAGGANATPAAQTNIGLWTCTDMGAPNGYPQIQIDIAGHDTANIAASNADFSPNSSTLVSGQIAIWAPETDFNNKASGTIENAITGTAAAVAAGTVEVPPIQIAGTGGVVDESTVDGFGAGAGITNTSPYQFPDDPLTTGYRAFRHFIRYSSGPYQETIFNDFTGKTYQWYDNNRIAEGGTGRHVTDGNTTDGGLDRAWDGLGQTPRANVVSVMYSVAATTSSPDPAVVASEPIHACVQIDTTHQELLGMSTYPITVRGTHPGDAGDNTYRIDGRDIIGGDTGTASSQIANVITGKQSYTNSWSYVIWRGGIVTDRGSLDYRIEVGAGVNPGNGVAYNGVTCNETDVATWVDAQTGDLSGFQTGTMADGTPIYGGITHMRVITSGDVPWAGNARGSASFGSGVLLGFQVRVKDDPATGAQEANQELIVYGSRARGVWDGDGQPTTANCTNEPVFGSGAPALGWCNLPFQDNGGSSVDATDSPIDFDPNVIERSQSGINRLVHADKIYIVDAALAVSKRNTASASEIVANGNTTEFEINPQVIGSALDEIDEVVLTDDLPNTMAFVDFTSPVAAPYTCSHSGGSSAVSPVDPTQTVTVGGTITCNYGDDLAGGWGSLDEGLFAFEVMIVGASADDTLTNEVELEGIDSNTGDPKASAISSASVFTGAPFDESVIVKAIDTGVGDCDEYPDAAIEATSLPAEPADWADRCERIVFEGTAGNGTTNMGFTLEMANQGNTPLTNVRFVDVLPHTADEQETFSNTGADGVPVPTIGDGRTPETDTTGDVTFLGLTGDVGSVWVTMDGPLTVSRDPDRAIIDTVWCSGLGGSNYPGGQTGPCPTDATDVTAVYAEMNDIDVGDKVTAALVLESVDHECDDIWTNTFGARVDEIGLPVRSNDVSIMVDCVFDLALTKVPDPAWSPGADWLTPGTSTVDFVIEMINQGDPINNFQITDYVDPAMFTFDLADNPAGTTSGGLIYAWDDSGANPVVTVNDPTDAASDPSSTLIRNGDTVQIPITLTISPAYVPAGPLSNKAEISYFDNDADDTNGDSLSGDIADVDSTPDGTDDDVLIDDETGLTSATGDEDDHDIAVIPVYDLAIEKANPTMTQTATGWVATFDVTVENQSNAPVTNIAVLETPPIGLTYASSDAATVTQTAGASAVLVTDADPNYNIDTLAVGDSVTFTITYDVTDLTAGPYTNSVQIDSFQDVNGNLQADADSTPGNDIDHGASNEDDDDVETVSLPFDLALVKKPFVNDPLYPDLLDGVQNGDVVLFHVEVFNQLTTIEDFEVIDYISAGWSFDLASQPSLVTLPGTNGGPALPFVWDDSGVNPIAQVDGVLPGGQSVVIPVALTVVDPVGGLRNEAEILSFDDDGNPDNGDSSTDPDDFADLDSTPDGEEGNDLLVDDEYTDDGTVDEDDHDIAFTDWYDVELEKQIFDGTDCTEGPVAITVATDLVEYCLTITNNGPPSPGGDLTNIAFTDTPPVGLVYNSETLVTGVTGTAGSYVVASLASQDSVTIQVRYAVDVGAMTSGSLNNVAEVAAMFDGDGAPAADVDSYTDSTPDSDMPTEDDEDLQTITIPYDLALQKTLGPVVGNQVTMYITVTNQSIAVEQVEITDYVDPASWAPFSAALNPPAAATGAAVPFSFAWDTTDPDNPVATVAPDTPGDKLAFGESVTIPIVLEVSPDFSGGVIDNHAEISNFDNDGDPDNGDGADGTLPEADSTPDGDDGNGPGEGANAVDDDIDGDPAAGGDEDDHDGVLIPIFDLALRKTLVSFSGRSATFAIEIFNQGGVTGVDMTIVDYLPAGMKSVDPDWTSNSDGTASIIVPGPLAAGESIVVEIDTQITGTGSFPNLAGIQSAFAVHPATGEPLDLDDIDSTQGDSTGDPLVENVIDNSDGDEDDSDIAFLEVAASPSIPTPATEAPTVPAPTVPAPAVVTTRTEEPASLAFTGTETRVFVASGLLMVAAGAALVAGTRRRRRADDLGLDWVELN